VPPNLTLGLVGPQLLASCTAPSVVWLYPALRPRLPPRVATEGAAASAQGWGDHMQRSAGLRAQHYRDMAAHFRSLAELEPLAGLRRHLRQLAAQHDEVAAGLEEAQSDEDGGAPRAALG
jgi:hypothetical protein